MTIEEFIEARIAEDEAIAIAAAKAGGTDWDWDVDQMGAPSDPIRYGVFDKAGHERVACIYKGEYDSGALSRHIARHDPARVLRQCAAFRVALEWYIDDDEMVMGATINAIAAIWSDHPDHGSWDE